MGRITTWDNIEEVAFAPFQENWAVNYYKQYYYYINNKDSLRLDLQLFSVPK